MLGLKLNCVSKRGHWFKSDNAASWLCCSIAGLHVIAVDKSVVKKYILLDKRETLDL